MRYYRIKLRFLSGLVSRIYGDTLWGQLMWCYLYRYGREELEGLLEAQHHDPLLVSDLLPEGHLPVPQLPKPVLRPESNPPEVNREMKKLVKNPLIPEEQFYQIRDKLSIQLLRETWLRMAKERVGQEESEKKDRKKKAKDTVEVLEFHNTYDRERFHVLKGGLFQTEVTYYKPEKVFQFFLGTALELDGKLEELLELLSDFGLGADHTLGKGRFRVLEITSEEDLFRLSEANAFMSLSPFVACDATPEKGFWKFQTKFGKVGEGIVKNPFKKPLMMYASGSLFLTEKVPEKFYGRLLDKVVHTDHIPVRHYAYAFPVPVRLLEEVL